MHTVPKWCRKFSVAVELFLELFPEANLVKCCIDLDLVPYHGTDSMSKIGAMCPGFI
jgi:hypothetical protein